MIKFWSTRNEYGYLSNFALYPIVARGKIWPTTEHFFQAMKFEGSKNEEVIRKLPTPKRAANFGRRRDIEIRSDWDSVKEDVMYEALFCKFTQYPDLKAELIGTDNEVIVEDSPFDYYWGCGRKGTGLNRLGNLLMQLREQLKSEN